MESHDELLPPPASESEMNGSPPTPTSGAPSPDEVIDYLIQLLNLRLVVEGLLSNASAGAWTAVEDALHEARGFSGIEPFRALVNEARQATDDTARQGIAQRIIEAADALILPAIEEPAEVAA